MSEIQTVCAVIHEIIPAKLHDLNDLREQDENVKPKDGDIVVLDNSKAHKADGVKQLIEAVGATVLYPPPVFSRLESH